MIFAMPSNIESAKYVSMILIFYTSLSETKIDKEKGGRIGNRKKGISVWYRGRKTPNAAFPEGCEHINNPRDMTCRKQIVSCVESKTFILFNSTTSELCGKRVCIR